MFLLIMNDMRSPKIEIPTIVAKARLAETIVAHLTAHYEPWTDGQWGKVFRKGSPYEWFNRYWGFSSSLPVAFWDTDFGHGITEIPDDLKQIHPRWRGYVEDAPMLEPLTAKVMP